jgi:hypothetical protein
MPASYGAARFPASMAPSIFGGALWGGPRRVATDP